MTHDYKRNGTTDLFAALNVATGEVIYDTKPRHSAKEVLGFFKLIDLHVPRHLDVHVVLDNLSAHKAPAVAKWLAHPRRKRWHLHFTPTSSSWLNLVEGWFKQLTDRRLRRGTFTSVDALIEAIEVWAERWNDDPKPFVWRKTADDIITKVRRGRTALTHQTKSRRTTRQLLIMVDGLALVGVRATASWAKRSINPAVLSSHDIPTR